MQDERLPIKMTLLRLLLVTALAGCQATQYQQAAPRDGFGEVELDANIWRIRFMHNAFTTRETAQSYWLYRAAELATSKGYDGFEVLSLGGRTRSAGDGLGRSSALLIEGEIRLLKKPFESIPPKTYNAAALRAVLDPYVAAARSEPTVAFRVEIPPPSSDELKLKMTYSIPCGAPGQADCPRAADRPAPEPAAVQVARPRPAPEPAAAQVATPKPAPISARPRPPVAGTEPPSLKPTGPCVVKPVMSDEDLANCGARVR